MQSYARLLAVMLFLALLFSIFQWSGLREHFSLAFLQQQILAHRVGGLLLFVLLFALGNLIQIPGWLFLAAAVLALGRTWGGMATYAAACASCALTFLLIRAIGGAGVGHDQRPVRRKQRPLKAHLQAPFAGGGSLPLNEVLQRERRTGAVAQQPFEPRPVGVLDAHRAIHREAAVVRPGAHFGGVILVDQPSFDEGAQDTGSHAGLNVGKRRRVESVGKGGMKDDARRIIRGDGRLEYSVDDATMEMDMLVQA